MNKNLNVLLVGINSKYIHSNLAIRCLSKYIKDNVKDNININFLEVSINNRYNEIIDALTNEDYDIIIFSAYI
ncbi:MAG: B12-binding domain-containing radical SAM protein, partial [Oscillospiraceae bacterium]